MTSVNLSKVIFLFTWSAGIYSS